MIEEFCWFEGYDVVLSFVKKYVQLKEPQLNENSK